MSCPSHPSWLHHSNGLFKQLMKCWFEVNFRSGKRRLWGFPTGGYEEFYLLGYNAVWSVESQLTFRENMSPQSSW
jgi:hypothetical protein